MGEAYQTINKHPLDNAVGISGDWYLCAITCSICSMSYTVKAKGNSTTEDVSKCPYCSGWKKL